MCFYNNRVLAHCQDGDMMTGHFVLQGFPNLPDKTN